VQQLAVDSLFYNKSRDTSEAPLLGEVSPQSYELGGRGSLRIRDLVNWGKKVSTKKLRGLGWAGWVRNGWTLRKSLV